MSSQHPPPAEATAIPTGTGPEAIRRALRGPPGRVALRMPSPPTPAGQRLALALLAAADASRGGSLLRIGTAELLLTEAPAMEAERAATQIEAVFGLRAERLALPHAAAGLLALPDVTPVPPPPPPPSAAGIEALADAAPLPALLQRDAVLRIAPGEPQRPALIRLHLPATALAPYLGAAAADADLAAHALDRLRSRLPDLLADHTQRDAMLGGAPRVPLLIDLPARCLPEVPAPPDGLAAPPSLIASLSVAEILATDLAPRRAALRHAGWGLAARGLDAARLACLAPGALPVDLLLLRWSPALAGRAAAAALRQMDPSRLVLTECDGPDALAWGLSVGIARYAGPSVNALLAAMRMAACRHADACDRAACTARGQAATIAGRAGCADQELLGALVPGA